MKFNPFKNKNNQPIEESNVSSAQLEPAVLSGALGGIATADSLEQQPRQPEIDAAMLDRIKELRMAVAAKYADHIDPQFEAHMTRDDIKEDIVQSWNEGLLPRVVQGPQAKGSGSTMLILHGEVPQNIFDMYADNEELEVGLVAPDEYGRSELHFDYVGKISPPTEADPNNPTAFYVESIKLPQMTHDSRYDVLEVTAGIGRLESFIQSSEARE